MVTSARLIATAVAVAALAVARANGAVGAPADPPAAANAFAPHLATSGEAIVATWIEPLPGASEARHRVAFSSFGAAGWSPPTTIVESSQLFANWADRPGIAQSGDGSLLAWWLEKLGGGSYAYGIRLARSLDRGATWRALGWLQDDASESEHGFVSMVGEGDGTRAFWLDGRATLGGGAMGLRSTWIGEAVAPSVVIDASVCDCCPTASVATATGAAVAYRDRTADELREIWLARLASGTGTDQLPVSRDGWKIAGCPVNGPAIAAVGGRLVAAWYGAPDDRGRVAVAWSDAAGAVFAPPIVVDGESPLGRVALTQLDSTSAVLVWLGRREGLAEVRLARLGEEGEVGAALVLGTTSAGRQSGVPAVAALPDGRLLVVWTEAASGVSRLTGRLLEPGDLSRR